MAALSSAESIAGALGEERMGGTSAAAGSEWGIGSDCGDDSPLEDRAGLWYLGLLDLSPSAARGRASGDGTAGCISSAQPALLLQCRQLYL
jgi:hypothetical protein